MRIVTLITRMIRGGAQRVALETAARLNARGHDAPLWCGPETGPEGSLLEEARARGVPVRIFPSLVRAIDPLRDLHAVGELARALRDARPDWVHTHSSKAGIVGREAAARAGVPRVAHTVHGWGFTPQTPPPLRSLFVRLERREARRGVLVFVNPWDREEGRRLGILGAGLAAGQAARTRVIPPGIDLVRLARTERSAEERQRIRRELRIPEAAPVAGFVGRLSPQKDPLAVLAAAAALRDRRFPAGGGPAGSRSGPRATPATEPLHWIVVGDGPLRSAFDARLAAGPALRQVVHCAGLVEDPAPWLAAMDFLVLPSRWEGTPLTVMEAMAAGLPVIASDLPGTRWALEGMPETSGAAPGSERPSAEPLRAPAGLLVPPGDADSLATAASWLAEEAAVRQELAATARRLAVARFGLDRMLEELLELYGGSGYFPDR